MRTKKPFFVASALLVCGALLGWARPEPEEKELTSAPHSKREIELRVKEAEAVIASYQQKVDSAKIDLKKDKIRLKYAERRVKYLRDLVKEHAVSDASWQEAEQRFEEAQVDCEASQNDIEEAEADLELVKIRKLLAAEGHFSFSLNPTMFHHK